MSIVRDMSTTDTVACLQRREDVIVGGRTTTTTTITNTIITTTTVAVVVVVLVLRLLLLLQLLLLSTIARSHRWWQNGAVAAAKLRPVSITEHRVVRVHRTEVVEVTQTQHPLNTLPLSVCLSLSISFCFSHCCQAEHRQIGDDFGTISQTTFLVNIGGLLVRDTR